ncbi:MAG: hypothetical protein LBD03_03410 [Methanobrevibacter sp.]|jgi:hypothetical protein|nr:hypothetical protein [Candidatus Methanovirga procula]
MKKFYLIILLIFILTSFSLSGLFGNNKISQDIFEKLTSKNIANNNQSIFFINDQINFMENVSDIISQKTDKKNLYENSTKEIQNNSSLNDINLSNNSALNEINDSIYCLKAKLPKESLNYKGKKIYLDPIKDCYYYSMDNNFNNETILTIDNNGTFIYKSNNNNASFDNFKITINNVYFDTKINFNLKIDKINNQTINQTVLNVSCNETNLTVGDNFGIYMIEENNFKITLDSYDDVFLSKLSGSFERFINQFKCLKSGDTTIRYNITGKNNTTQQKNYLIHIRNGN